MNHEAIRLAYPSAKTIDDTAGVFDFDGKKIEIGSNQVHYSVKPGDFIFFNSFMPHAYSHHKGKNKFRFIHFNMAAVTDPSLTKISEDENNGI